MAAAAKAWRYSGAFVAERAVAYEYGHCADGGGMWLVRGWLADTAVFIQLMLVSSVGGIIYVVVCAGLRLEELNRLWQYGRRRFKR